MEYLPNPLLLESFSRAMNSIPPPENKTSHIASSFDSMLTINCSILIKRFRRVSLPLSWPTRKKMTESFPEVKNWSIDKRNRTVTKRISQISTKSFKRNEFFLGLFLFVLAEKVVDSMNNDSLHEFSQNHEVVEPSCSICCVSLTIDDTRKEA
jgi:hypothetical protein